MTEGVDRSAEAGKVGGTAGFEPPSVLGVAEAALAGTAGDVGDWGAALSDPAAAGAGALGDAGRVLFPASTGDGAAGEPPLGEVTA